MPIPIKPVHNLDLHAELFDIPNPVQSLGLSDIQIQMLGMNSAPNKKEAGRLSNRDIDILREIEAGNSEVVTASTDYKAPFHITDADILALKTAGLLVGNGRTVTLTERAKVALRDHYLSTDTVNEFRKARSKDRFDLEEARSVKVSESKPKFRKVTWLTDNSGSEFDIRFVADTDKKRTKGLMYADPLEDNEVVLFVFDSPDCYSFWNKNVDFPLSLAFLNKDMEVVDFKDLEKQSPKSAVPNSNAVVYVIEAKKGTFEKHNIGKGDQFQLKNKKLVVKKQ